MKSTLDPFNAFVFRGSLRASRACSKTVLKDWKIAVKDNIAVKSWPLTCASRSLKNYISPYSADIVESTIDMGAEIVGKLNMDEFGMGSRGERSIFGATLNPLNITRSAGGSSSGCSAAVAGGLCRLAIGSDTGGSMRLPASYTGVIGYKPTWGLLSRYGLVSYAPSLDTVGLIGRSVDDIIICLEGLLQNQVRDKWNDSTLVKLNENELDAFESLPLEGITFGIVEEWMNALEDMIDHPIYKVIDALENKSGSRIKLISIPELDGNECLERYYETACMEASSTLARYCGHFFEMISPGKGLSIEFDLHDGYKNKIEKYQNEMLGSEVVKRINRGRDLLSNPEGKYLKQSAEFRRVLGKSFESIFKKECCDVLIGPTAFTEAPKLSSESSGELAKEKEDDIFTVPANLIGYPAISLPLHGLKGGINDVIGTQIMSYRGEDRLLLRVARELENLFK